MLLKGKLFVGILFVGQLLRGAEGITGPPEKVVRNIDVTKYISDRDRPKKIHNRETIEEVQFKAVQKGENRKAVLEPITIKIGKKNTLIQKRVKIERKIMTVGVERIGKSIPPKEKIKAVQGKQDIIAVKTTESTKAVKR